MRSTKNRVRLCAILLCLNLIFIWGNSLMPGEVSDRISRWAAEFLGSSLDIPADMEQGHSLLRKLAHFSEFACLGLLLCWRAGMAGKRGMDLAVLTLLGGIVTACLDETIQIFVAERSSSLVDVWIDVSGVVIGMIFLLMGHHLIKRIYGKTKLEDNL